MLYDTWNVDSTQVGGAGSGREKKQPMRTELPVCTYLTVATVSLTLYSNIQLILLILF